MTYVRHSPDNTIEPMMKIPDEEILAIWKPLVPPEFRAGRSNSEYSDREITEEVRETCAKASYARRTKKQFLYAQLCTPKEDGDETIIRLFQEGLRLDAIADATGRRYQEVRDRLVDCHPTRKPLR